MKFLLLLEAPVKHEQLLDQYNNLSQDFSSMFLVRTKRRANPTWLIFVVGVVGCAFCAPKVVGLIVCVIGSHETTCKPYMVGFCRWFCRVRILRTASGEFDLEVIAGHPLKYVGVPHDW